MTRKSLLFLLSTADIPRQIYILVVKGMVTAGVMVTHAIANTGDQNGDLAVVVVKLSILLHVGLLVDVICGVLGQVKGKLCDV